MKKSRNTNTLTKVNIDALCTMVKDGVPRTQAAAALGINRITLWGWMKQAETITKPANDRERLLVYLMVELGKARSKFCERCIKMIQVKGGEDWRAWAFLAERQFPEELAEHKTVTAELNSSPVVKALEKIAELTEDGITKQSSPAVDEGGE